jgi:GntR family transcriptional regulator
MSLKDLKFSIDPNTKTPMWLQIRNELFDCLYKDILRPGQLIPNLKPHWRFYVRINFKFKVC